MPPRHVHLCLYAFTLLESSLPLVICRVLIELSEEIAPRYPQPHPHLCGGPSSLGARTTCTYVFTSSKFAHQYRGQRRRKVSLSLGLPLRTQLQWVWGRFSCFVLFCPHSPLLCVHSTKTQTHHTRFHQMKLLQP